MKELLWFGLLRLRCLIFLALLFSVPGIASAQPSDLKFSTVEQLREEFGAVPCKDAERLTAVKALFEKVGAPASGISVEKFKNVENLVVLKQGRTTTEKIVIGAHYDKVSDGCGAIDNWSGIVVLAHLYRSLKDVQLKKTLVFVAFGKEEKGLIGSQAMAGAIKKEELEQYCAMINIDSLGLGAPQVGGNMSSAKLTKLAAELAREMKLPFGSASIEYADADSSSFKAKKIPALTIHALTEDWADILHSNKDQASKVNATSVYLGYRLALYLIARLEDSSCAAYR